MSILIGDCRTVLATLPERSVQCCVTSPPYFGLRDYGVDGQIGAEMTVDSYVAELVAVFAEVRRLLADDGTLWLNLGDSYANDGKWGGSSGGKHAQAMHGATGIGRERRSTGLKPKDLMMIPARVALALQSDGWYLRSDIIWHKPNPMPESVRDRPTSAHEHVFLLTKNDRYYYDAAAIAEPVVKGWNGSSFTTGKTLLNGQGRTSAADRTETDRRNKRNVWTIPTQAFAGSHFAVMPEALVEPCILAGSRPGDTVLDPFAGAGTVALVSEKLRRKAVGIELNPEYAQMARDRIAAWHGPLLAGVGE